jgi:cation transport ATPase
MYWGQSADTIQKKTVALHNSTDKACFSCTAEINLLDLTIKVSGKNAEDVKVVTSYLVKQVRDIKYETDKIKHLNALSMNPKNKDMKLVVIAMVFFISIFWGFIHLLTGLAVSTIGWYKFISILMSLPVVLILGGVLALKFIGVMEESSFLELVKLVLRLIYDTIKLLIERREPNDRR